jgi:hypothetical protein
VQINELISIPSKLKSGLDFLYRSDFQQHANIVCLEEAEGKNQYISLILIGELVDYSGGS